MLTTKNNIIALTHCIGKLISAYFINWQNSTSIYTLISGSISVNHASITIDIDKTENIAMEQFIVPANSIILDLEQNPLGLHMERLYNTRFYSAEATYFLIGKEIPPNISSILLNYFIKQAIFVNTENGNYYTYNVGDCLDEIVPAGECSSLGEGLVALQNRKYEWDRPKSLTLCTYRNCEACSLNEEEGLFQIIWDQLNITVRKEFIEEEVLANCEIFFGDIQATEYLYLSITNPYIYDHLSWYLPKRFLPIGLYPLRMFDQNLWLSWFLTALIVSTVWYIIEFSLYAKKYYTQFVKKFCTLAFLFLEQSASIRLLHIAEFIIASISIYAAFNMSAMFKTNLFYFLMQERYDTTLRNLEDMRQHNLEIMFPVSEMGFSNLKYHVQDSIGTDYQLKDCGTTKQCWDSMYTNMNKATLLSDLKINRLMRQDTYGNTYRRYRKLRPPFFSIRTVAFCKKGHPFLPIFNRYLGYLMKFGFSDFIYQARPKALLARPKRLSLTHFMAPFTFWAVGNMSAMFVLVLENIFHWYKKKYSSDRGLL